jgi:hypothetical protein
MPRALTASILALTATCSLHAQPANEVVFVGSSVAGSNDPHHFVWSQTGAYLSGTSPYTDNVTDAEWTDQGRALYIATMFGPGITRCDWDGYSPTFSGFWTTNGGCFGLAVDKARECLWTFSNTNATGPYRELYCLDIDTSSPTYGAVLAQTNGLSGTPRERWELSLSGNRAIVPNAFINGSQVDIIDTDPSSPNFTQIIGSTWAFGAAIASIAMTIDCEITIDDQYAFLAWQGLISGIPGSGVGVLHLATMTWLDFDASTSGVQDFVTPLQVITGLSISYDGSVAILTGAGANGGAMRIDMDFANPHLSTGTQIMPGNPGMDHLWSVALSPTLDRAAMTRNASDGSLLILDTNSGAILQNVAFPGSDNLYTTAFQDASPMATYVEYGAGCAGSLGTPTLSATPGSLPIQGSNFQVEIRNMPIDLAIMTVTLESSFHGGMPLPLPIPSAPGCSLLVSPLVNSVVVGSGGVGTWAWSVPSSPAFFGTMFYNQAFVLDPGANQLGVVTTNAAQGRLGY